MKCTCTQLVLTILYIIIMQARYYAKLYNHDQLKDFPAKLDTDRGIIYYRRDKCNEYYSDHYDYGSIWLGLSLIPLNILIAIIGIYCLNLTITEYESYQHINSSRRIYSIYWASVIIAGVINIACLVVDIVQIREVAFIKFMAPIFLIESVAVFIVLKKFRISSCVCGCCSRPLVMRLVHTLAICHLLWFLHRVGSGLIVATFFIALAPGQTIAALSLMYLVILVSIVYVTCCIYSLQNRRMNCKMVCKLFLLTITYLCLVCLAICFTLIYIAFAENGLTSSTIGSILLSFIPPMAIFFIGVVIKRQLKVNNILGSESVASESPESDKRDEATILNERTPLVKQSLAITG